MAQPVQIVLHDPKTGEQKTYVRSIIPWGILKRAMRLAKQIDHDDLTEADLDEMAAFLVVLFGDQFSVEEVNNGMDIADMVPILKGVIDRATSLAAANPTKAA